MECTLILMPFTEETASLHAKPGKWKLHLSAQSSQTSETFHFDVLTHNLYFCAYSGPQNTLEIHSINLCTWFGSCEDRRQNFTKLNPGQNDKIEINVLEK